MTYPDSSHPDTCAPAPNDAWLLAEATLLHEGRHAEPFTVLGRHACGSEVAVRVFLPDACDVCLVEGAWPLRRLAETDLFEWRGPAEALPLHYRLRWIDHAGHAHSACDPYSFGPQLSLYDLHLFNEGRHLHAYRMLGAHPRTVDDIAGVVFAVWAPCAVRVSVLGEFNAWDGRRHPMRRRGEVWELFVPAVTCGARYLFEIRTRNDGELLRKTDPYGRSFEFRPATAAIVTSDINHAWGDEAWVLQRSRRDWTRAPLAIYEVHLGSWQRDADGGYLSYPELARRLVAYVRTMGFTHLELMPITEHPLDASWGYQPTGYFAPTSRHGDLDDFRQFVDYCHQAGIGVILDWVPGHFPKDAHALARFDGSCLYEYADPARGEHRGWGTLVFDYSRTQVKNFLMASACFWLEECHLDGLRVDAVASMLYLDYARESGEWLPNPFGGNENLEAIAFLRELNDVIHRRCPGVLMIAEESTAWPLVTRPSWMGGLGFGMKWNMGWMHDTLEYLSQDPALRSHHHELLTFGLLYTFTENFVLPLSHDEVVHGKGSLLARMPGDRRQRLASLRLLYVYMWTYPGKKFLFMGNELAQEGEWDCHGRLDWTLLDQPAHRGVQTLIADLNHLYCTLPSLHEREFVREGFEWLDCHDAARSVVVYVRRGLADELAVVVLNCSALARPRYRVGVPVPGRYRQVLNSDDVRYGGAGTQCIDTHAGPDGHMGQACSLLLDLPPLTGVLLVPYAPAMDVGVAVDS